MICVGLIEFARTPGATDKTPRKRNWAKTAAIGAGAVGVVGAGAYALKRGKPLGPPKPSGPKTPSPTSTNPTPKPPSPSPSPAPKPSGGFTPKQSTKLGYQKSRRLDALDKEDPEIGRTARNLREPVALSDNRAIKRRQENKRKMKEWGRRNRKSTKGVDWGDTSEPLSYEDAIKEFGFNKQNHLKNNINFARTPGAKDLKPRKTRTLYSHLRKGAVTGSQIGAAKGVVEGLGNTGNLKGKQKLLGIAGSIAGSTWKNSLRGLHIGTASGGATYIGRRSIDKLRGNDKYKYKIKGKGDNFLFRPRLNRSAYM